MQSEKSGLIALGFPAIVFKMEWAIADNRISRKDYLEGELVSEIKHEYVAGQVYAMSGGTLGHQRIAGNFLSHSLQALRSKSCFPTGSDFKLAVSIDGDEEAFYYPDGMIICVPIDRKALYSDSPKVILEVLSPTTRRIDETQKYRDYLTIPTLDVYVLADADAPLLTVHRRDGNGFRRELISGSDAVLDLPEVGINIPLSELYFEALDSM